ncbi:response regulator [Ancylomarina sp. YFZ004]
MSWENRNFRLLLVEDNKLNQIVVKFSLKRFGYEIITANNGIEAIEEFKQGEFDFILMDVMMPEMDGLEATKLIRKLEKGKDIPIIALTADVITATVNKCKDCGMSSHMSKPFEVEKLFEILESFNL